jgi:hypothetical protein
MDQDFDWVALQQSLLFDLQVICGIIEMPL